MGRVEEARQGCWGPWGLDQSLAVLFMED